MNVSTITSKLIGFLSTHVGRRGILCFFVAYLSLMLTRVAYMLENWNTFADVFADNSIWTLLKGCFVFDTSAIMYTNSIIVLMLVLAPYLGKLWEKATVWMFTIINGLAVVLNLCDAVYLKFTGHRTTISVFGEFKNENNLGKVFTSEIVNHWYLVLFGVLLIIALYFSSKAIICRLQPKSHSVLKRVIVFLLFIPLCIAGIRGGFTTAVRPITISNASQYVVRPQHAPLILNTPFSLLRTIGKNVFKNPEYFNPQELNAIYTPVHNPSDTAPGRGKNIVILIVESFGREYIGAYNEHLDGGRYKGYTPFVDSLYNECLSFDYTFANGRQSIDGMPSILSGIPRFIEPFFVTPASVNDVSGIAGELGNMGYHSAFFHGAENGSMGFEAFANASGFKEYYGRTEFNQDKRFRGDKDFDGTWAIWDEPFLQFYAMKMSEFKQPFVSTVFTASSHHPFRVPTEYENRFKDDNAPSIQGDNHNPIHKCISYTDMSLRRFFETARRQPWFQNTIFVITSDHTNIYDHKEYGTDLALFTSPILFYDPSGQMPRGRRHCIAQQTDIMPTLLSYVGYDRSYVGWGIDLLNTPDADTWAVNHTAGGVYQYVKGDYLIQFDGNEVKAVYNYKQDWMLQKPLPATSPEIKSMERELKAIIQTYMQRMVDNQLTIK